VKRKSAVAHRQKPAARGRPARSSSAARRWSRLLGEGIKPGSSTAAIGAARRRRSRRATTKARASQQPPMMAAMSPAERVACGSPRRRRGRQRDAGGSQGQVEPLSDSQRHPSDEKSPRQAGQSHSNFGSKVRGTSNRETTPRPEPEQPGEQPRDWSRAIRPTRPRRPPPRARHVPTASGLHSRARDTTFAPPSLDGGCCRGESTTL